MYPHKPKPILIALLIDRAFEKDHCITNLSLRVKNSLTFSCSVIILLHMYECYVD